MRKFTTEELADAKRRLDASLDRGTDEEYGDYITRLMRSRDKYIRKLEAVAKALLECERERKSRAKHDKADVAPDRQLYMKAVELAREALEGGEQNV